MQHNFESSSSSGTFVVGLLCGAAVGAALGVAFAPRPGVETRKVIAESGQRLRDEAKRTYVRASESVNGAMTQGREAIERGREAFEQTRTELGAVASEDVRDHFARS